MSQDVPHPLHFERFNQTARGLLMEFFFSHKGNGSQVSDSCSQGHQRVGGGPEARARGD